MKVIITGSTGMVGKGVLLECLENSDIDGVLIINRSSLDLQHPKLTEILLSDFSDVQTIKDELQGYDACFYCMGISALGMDEESYSKITYEATKAFADLLHSLNPNSVFIYVSGSGTDSTEKGRLMWARVKGKTENMIFNRGFRDAYAFRPGVILPEKGIKSRTNWYNISYVIMRPLFPLFKLSKNVTTTTKLGQAMIALLKSPSSKKIIYNADINQLADGIDPGDN